jgi:hypothetical protein
MPTDLENEVYNATVTVSMGGFRTDGPTIMLDLETSKAIVDYSWAELERALVDANAEFSMTDKEPHERILALHGALVEAAKHADVIYTLTPMPEQDEG